MTVLAPTLLAIVYYGLVASDVFISESRFLVTSPQHRIQGGLFGELLQGTGLSHAHDEAFTVHDYILSRDALRELGTAIHVQKYFADDQIDFINRFPHPGGEKSFEAFYKYYGNHVGIDYDSSSSISTLKVRAFTASGAELINEQLLQVSERLINALNERSRQDLIRYAVDEVTLATNKATAAAVALHQYRSQQKVFEPDRQAAIQLESVAKLQGDLITTEAQLAQIQTLSPSNPQITGLATRADTLRHAIASESAKITSVTDSFSSHAPDFERLTLESMFADKQLGIALADLETQRSEALRQQLYLERLVQPNVPDEAMEPRRLRSVFTVFFIGTIAWGVVSLLMAAIREHSN